MTASYFCILPSDWPKCIYSSIQVQLYGLVNSDLRAILWASFIHLSPYKQNVTFHGYNHWDIALDFDIGRRSVDVQISRWFTKLTFVVIEFCFGLNPSLFFWVYFGKLMKWWAADNWGKYFVSLSTTEVEYVEHGEGVYPLARSLSSICSHGVTYHHLFFCKTHRFRNIWYVPGGDRFINTECGATHNW